ncbi:hypothetical protein [Sinorhizobium mexicanum]|uniref:Uncharacterized protein n=1 Tax=Sinorhizobium mexicanum TaxID=375549 RepID=A0A859QD35_9HYPH|nr:hypothetical protein [Sinorhizobium mexicanum]MBP1883695.1 putative Fe-S radical SAM superfamily protein PflX [Sinorhizobium mexicanum]QLL62873.1 hypothetical protein FKV68_16190 [Sinorhizobium mexicanum]
MCSIGALLHVGRAPLLLPISSGFAVKRAHFTCARCQNFDFSGFESVKSPLSPKNLEENHFLAFIFV